MSGCFWGYLNTAAISSGERVSVNLLKYNDLSISILVLEDLICFIYSFSSSKNLGVIKIITHSKLLFSPESST